MTELLDRAREIVAKYWADAPGHYSEKPDPSEYLDGEWDNGSEVQSVLAALSTLPDAVAGEREAAHELALCAGRLVVATDGKEALRQERLAVLKSLENLADAIERGDHLAAAIRKEPS